MRLLLDTHALIWALAEPERLTDAVRSAIESPDNQILVSAASTWEIAIKAALGKIDLSLDELRGALAETHFEELPVSIRHTLHLAHLPPVHRDPFDRLLIAQALSEDIRIVTHDAAFSRYPVTTLW